MDRLVLAVSISLASLALAPASGRAGSSVLPGMALLSARSIAPRTLGTALSPGAACRAAIARAEHLYGIPAHLLAAIGRVESGRRDADGQVNPWPFSINVEGDDTIFENRQAATAGVRALLAGGTRSIDVGCMQVNLMYHPDAFSSLEEAFDPWRNADYAARFLVQLRAQTGSWASATASYHSATPELGGPYAAKVQAAFAQENAVAPAGLPTAGTGNGTIRPAAALAGVSALGNVAATGAVGRSVADMTVPTGRPTRMGVGGAILAGSTGRGLAEYRSAPVRLANSLFRR